MFLRERRLSHQHEIHNTANSPQVNAFWIQLLSANDVWRSVDWRSDSWWEHTEYLAWFPPFIVTLSILRCKLLFALRVRCIFRLNYPDLKLLITYSLEWLSLRVRFIFAFLLFVAVLRSSFDLVQFQDALRLRYHADSWCTANRSKTACGFNW